MQQCDHRPREGTTRFRVASGSEQDGDGGCLAYEAACCLEPRWRIPVCLYLVYSLL